MRVIADKVLEIKIKEIESEKLVKYKPKNKRLFKFNEKYSLIKKSIAIHSSLSIKILFTRKYHIEQKDNETYQRGIIFVNQILNYVI